MFFEFLGCLAYHIHTYSHLYPSPITTFNNKFSWFLHACVISSGEVEIQQAYGRTIFLSIIWAIHLLTLYTWEIDWGHPLRDHLVWLASLIEIARICNLRWKKFSLDWLILRSFVIFVQFLKFGSCRKEEVFLSLFFF